MKVDFSVKFWNVTASDAFNFCCSVRSLLDIILMVSVVLRFADLVTVISQVY